MKKVNLRLLLEKKNLNELKAIAKKVGLIGYSNLNKNPLIAKILSEESLRNKLEDELGLRRAFLKKRVVKNFWFQLIVTTLVSLSIAYFFYKQSASKSDINEIKSSIDNNEVLLQKMEKLEKYKKKFLESGMNLHYKLFSINDKGVIVSIEELRNPSLRANYETAFVYDNDRKTITLKLKISEFQFPQDGLVANANLSDSFPIKEDYFFDYGPVKSKDNNCIKYVLLDENRYSPIFAIGMGTCNTKR